MRCTSAISCQAPGVNCSEHPPCSRVDRTASTGWGACSKLLRWFALPQMRVVRLHTGDHEERQRLKREVLGQPESFNVAVTT